MRTLAVLLLVCGCGDDVMSTGGGGSGGGSAGQGGSQPMPDASTPDAPQMVSPDANNLPTCGCWLGDGTYCAASVALHAQSSNCQVAALSGHEGDVFSCAGGTWTVSQPCANGCYIAPDGVPDACVPAGQPHYKLPWQCGTTYHVTQGNNGDICGGGTGDHTGTQAFAWDFGIPRHTALKAARAGRVSVAANVVGPGQNCYDGCTQPFGTSEFWTCCNNCINTSNHVNIDHGDGQVTTYWHMDHVTVTTGQMIAQGDVIGYSGTSGCSSGPHLHFQVMGNCPTGEGQSISIAFDDAGIPACGQDVTSRNSCP